MSSPHHAAIEALCHILDDLPKARRADAIYRACLSVGQAPEPTGLEPDPNRKIRQLYWELTTKELRERLMELVNEVHIDEQLLVLGIVGSLDHHLAVHATPEYAERKRDKYLAALEKFERERKLPISQRQHQVNDDEIRDLIEKTKELAEQCELRRQQTEATLESLRQSVAKVLTEEFWQNFSSQRFWRPDE